MAGTITNSTIQNDTSSPPNFRNTSFEIGNLCRAWVNFDAATTGSPVIKASFNVSSITDQGVGDYTVNFATAFTDANYAIVCENIQSVGNSPVNISKNGSRVDTASLVNLVCSQGVVRFDGLYNAVAIFR